MGIYPVRSVILLMLLLAFVAPHALAQDPAPNTLGWIIPYVTVDAPTGCLPANGSMYLEADYPDLYAALDPAFIVDSEYFKTPDLRGRVSVGAGEGVGLTSRVLAETGGEESFTLTTDQLPAHDHDITIGATSVGTATEPGSLSVLSPTGGTTDITSTSVGNGDPIDIMPPWIAVNYCVMAINVLPLLPPEGVTVQGTTVTTVMGPSAQEVAFKFEASAGDVAIVTVLGANAMLIGMMYTRNRQGA